jgi:hypothetical protein
VVQIGMVAGLRHCGHNNKITIVAYTTNERLMQPQLWNGIASGGFNHLDR